MASSGAEDITSSIAESLLQKVALPANNLTSLTKLSSRPKKLHSTMFDLLSKKEVRAMIPDSLKSMSVSEIKQKCLRKLEKLTPSEIETMILQDDSTDGEPTETDANDDGEDNDNDDDNDTKSSLTALEGGLGGSASEGGAGGGGDRSGYNASANSVKGAQTSGLLPTTEANVNQYKKERHGAFQKNGASSSSAKVGSQKSFPESRSSGGQPRRSPQHKDISFKIKGTKTAAAAKATASLTTSAKIATTMTGSLTSDQCHQLQMDESSSGSTWASGAADDDRWSRSPSPERAASIERRKGGNRCSVFKGSDGERQPHGRKAPRSSKASNYVKKTADPCLKFQHRDPDEDSPIESIDAAALGGVDTGKTAGGKNTSDRHRQARKENESDDAAVIGDDNSSQQLENLDLDELERRARALKALMLKLDEGSTADVSSKHPNEPSEAKTDGVKQDSVEINQGDDAAVRRMDSRGRKDDRSRGADGTTCSQSPSPPSRKKSRN